MKEENERKWISKRERNIKRRHGKKKSKRLTKKEENVEKY